MTYSNDETQEQFEQLIIKYYENEIECRLHDYLGVTLEDMIVYNKTGKIPENFISQDPHRQNSN